MPCFCGTYRTEQYQRKEELEPEATVIEDGFTINEREVPDAADDIADWLAELGY